MSRLRTLHGARRSHVIAGTRRMLINDIDQDDVAVTRCGLPISPVVLPHGVAREGVIVDRPDAVWPQPRCRHCVPLVRIR